MYPPNALAPVKDHHSRIDDNALFTSFLSCCISGLVVFEDLAIGTHNAGQSALACDASQDKCVRASADETVLVTGYLLSTILLY
jgi:hypothetical protein